MRTENHSGRRDFETPSWLRPCLAALDRRARIIQAYQTLEMRPAEAAFETYKTFL